jgi:hypothetical protein
VIYRTYNPTAYTVILWINYRYSMVIYGIYSPMYILQVCYGRYRPTAPYKSRGKYQSLLMYQTLKGVGGSPWVGQTNIQVRDAFKRSRQDRAKGWRSDAVTPVASDYLVAVRRPRPAGVLSSNESDFVLTHRGVVLGNIP